MPAHTLSEHHILPKKIYVRVFLALIVLTAITTAVAYIDLGAWNTVAALTIAVCKATLVVLFFMHLRYARGLTRIVILAAVMWLGILIALTLGDVFTRRWTPNGRSWQASALASQPVNH